MKNTEVHEIHLCNSRILLNNSKQPSVSDFNTIDQSQGPDCPSNSRSYSYQDFISKLGDERGLHRDFPPQRQVIRNGVTEIWTNPLESQELSEREVVEWPPQRVREEDGVLAKGNFDIVKNIIVGVIKLKTN
jgi:hypothetical protein